MYKQLSASFVVPFVYAKKSNNTSYTTDSAEIFYCETNQNRSVSAFYRLLMSLLEDVIGCMRE